MIVKHNYRSGGSSQYSARRRYRYGGSGIFSNLLKRTLVRDNIQKLTNSVSKPDISQKVVDAVVNGSTDALKSGTQKGIEKAASVLKVSTQKGIDSIVNKKKRKENRQAIKAAIDKLPAGRGIVFD